MRLSMDCVNFFRIGPKKKRAALNQINNSSIEDVIVFSLR